MDKSKSEHTILGLLRTQTRQQHDRIEKSLDLTNGAETVDEYRNLLERFFGFYAPTEPLAAAIAAFEGVRFDFAPRLKTPHLQTDLLARGLSVEQIAQLPICKNLPVIETPAQFFGYLYVAEGSTLGGQIISRHFAQKLDISEENGGMFFQAYGAQTGAMWRGFQTAITDFAEDGTHEDEIIAAAIETFEKLQIWMEAQKKLSASR